MWLTEPMRLFGGLWTIPMWGYMDAYTSAQVELLAADCPITVPDRKRREKGEKGKPSPLRISPERYREMERQWKERYKDGVQVTLDLSKHSLMKN